MARCGPDKMAAYRLPRAHTRGIRDLIAGIRDLQNQIIALLTTMIRNARADAAERVGNATEGTSELPIRNLNLN